MCLCTLFEVAAALSLAASQTCVQLRDILPETAFRCPDFAVLL